MSCGLKKKKKKKQRKKIIHRGKKRFSQPNHKEINSENMTRNNFFESMF